MKPLLAILTGCVSSPPSSAVPEPTASVSVVAGSVPVHHLAERIGAGQPWELSLLPPVDADPGTWRPDAAAVSATQAADLILLNGAGYERWATTTALPATRVVRTADGVPPLQTGRRTHSHGSDGAHSHGDVDPHTWMDPRAYETQALAVHAALSRLPGADSTALDAALHALRDQLGQLDADLQAAAPVPAPPMASNHPSFGHLGRRLGLSIVSLDIDPAVPPDAGTMADIHDWAASGEMPVMLWEAQPSAAVMDALPATVVHLTLDPLEHPRPGRGYAHAEQAQTNVAALRSISRRRAPAESHRMGAGGGGR